MKTCNSHAKTHFILLSRPTWGQIVPINVNLLSVVVAEVSVDLDLYISIYKMNNIYKINSNHFDRKL